MGLVAWIVYQGIYILSDSMVVAVIPAVLVAAVVYFVMLIVVKGVTETELKAMPKGYLLVKAAKKVHLM
jgi:stage V sporulation protein B